MALQFCDSFDHYTSVADMSLKWTSVAGTPTIGATGRNSTNGMTLSGSSGIVRKTISSTPTTLVAGCAVKRVGGLTATMLMAFGDGATFQVECRHDASGFITITRNGTVLATSTLQISADVFYHLQFKATINNTTGSAEVKINDAVWVTVSGVDTQNTANAYTNGVILQNTSNSLTLVYDDFWLCDTTGSVNNDYLGDVRIECLFPTGAGNSTQWTPSAGSNYQNVDDTAPDGDTTYNSSNTPGQIDDFAFGDLVTAAGTVKAVQNIIIARKDDAGTRTLRRKAYISSNYYDGANFNLSTSYAMYMEVLEQNPNTAAAWLIAGVNGANWGYEMMA